jgi:hypothetical protein
MYKTLGFRRLCETFCPASAFVTADRDEARNPQRFIHVTVVRKQNKHETILHNNIDFFNSNRTNSPN